MWLPSNATPLGAWKPYEPPESVLTQEPSLAFTSVSEGPDTLVTQMWLPSNAAALGPAKP